MWCPSSQRNWPFPGLPGTGKSTSQLQAEKANSRVTDSPKCESTAMIHPATGSFPMKWWEFFFFFFFQWEQRSLRGKHRKENTSNKLCKPRNNSALFCNKRKGDALPRLPAPLHCVFQQVQLDGNWQGAAGGGCSEGNTRQEWGTVRQAWSDVLLQPPAPG